MTTLINRSTVLEKEDYVSTGLLTFAEGDLIEVEIAEWKLFDLGCSVKVTIYAATGLQCFDSTIVGKDEGTLIFLNTLGFNKRLTEKRGHSRIEVKQVGMIHAMKSAGIGEEKLFAEPMTVEINNISLSGMGFVIQHDLGFKTDMMLQMTAELGMPFSCMAEVARIDKSKQGLYIGVRFHELTPEKTTSLRAFVLKFQVERRLKDKQNKVINKEENNA